MSDSIINNFTHNNKVAEGEPRWGGVDKTKLPRIAHAQMGDPDLKTTWKYPHHWIKDAGGLNDEGIYTSGTMYLHRGGLIAAWQRANQSGTSIEPGALQHIEAHRKALGMDTNANNSTQILTHNSTISGYKYRDVTFEGKQYIAVPTVLLVEGVHNGSAGRLLHTAKELSKFPHAWNGRPVPIDHPMNAEGQGCSCNSPTVMEKRSSGSLWECDFDGKLHGEIWFDREKLSSLSPVVLEKIEKGLPIEVSTGYFSDILPVPGVWNGEPYDGEVVNIRPDHLAVLPNSVGACSIEDGCGIRANKNLDSIEIPVDVLTLFVNAGVRPDGAKYLYQKVVSNALGIDGQLSHDDVRDQLWNYLSDLKANDDTIFHTSLKGVFSNYFVYEMEKRDSINRPKYYMLGYSVDDAGNISISSDEPKRVDYIEKFVPIEPEKEPIGDKPEVPVPEVPVTEVPVTEVTIPSSNIKNGGNNMEDKNKTKALPEVAAQPSTNKDAQSCPECIAIVNELVSNKDYCFTDQDREELAKLPLASLRAMEKSLRRDTKPSVINMDSLPEEVRSLVKNAAEIEARQKGSLIKSILSNMRNSLTEEQLRELSVHVLENMTSIGGNGNFFGANGSYSPTSPEVEPLPNINIVSELSRPVQSNNTQPSAK